MSETEYAKSETVWCSRTCLNSQKTDRSEKGVKVFLRYVNYIVRTSGDNPRVVLEAAYKLQLN